MVRSIISSKMFILCGRMCYLVGNLQNKNELLCMEFDSIIYRKRTKLTPMAHECQMFSN